MMDGCPPLRQIFIFGLWGIIRTYQPNPLTGLFFFVTASCAAFAFVSSYLMFLFGAAGGGLYGMAKLAESNMRIEGGGEVVVVRVSRGGTCAGVGSIGPGEGTIDLIISEMFFLLLRGASSRTSSTR